MKTKLLKYIGLAAVLSVAGGMVSMADAAVVVVREPAPASVVVVKPQPTCVYYDGYMKCREGVRYVTYKPISAVKVCKGHGMCHWVYCYKPSWGTKVCQAYYPNRVY